MGKNILLVENLGVDFFKSRLKYAEFLAAHGWQVFVLVPDDEYEYTEQIRQRGFPVYTYVRDHHENWFTQVLKILRAYRQVFREHRIDIIHSYRLFPNFINVVANLFSKRKVVIHITGLGLVYSNNSPKYFVYRQISNLVYIFMILFSNRTIVQNPDDGRQLSFFPSFKKKIALVKGSGVDMSLYNRNEAERSALRVSTGIKENEILFVCVTRLLWEKGIKELCDAFATITASDENVKLFIVGGPDVKNPRHVTQEYIRTFDNNPQIVFTGERNDIRNMLQCADVFVYPSYYREGIPRSVLEALATGLPVITTDMPGCNLTVTEGENGYLIAPRSVGSVRSVAEKMISEASRFEQMGKKSRELAANVFAENIVYAETLKLYYLIT